MKFENTLRKLAAKSPHPRYLHATVIIRGGAIVSTGYNHGKIHSEIMALNNLWPNKRKNNIAINIRLGPKGELANSSPCVPCQEALREAGIRRIFYSYEEGMRYLNLRKKQ